MENFRIICSLGKGASGIVYKAQNLKTGGIVAIKATQPSENDLFEIDILKRIQHPNIVQLLGFHKTSDRIFMIMEFCDKGSLDKLGALSEEVASLYIGQILYGLAYLHDQGVIHRDIKAANILLSSTNGNTAKLADFGIAWSDDKEGGMFEGSTYWMAPEVIELNGAVSSSDIWSIGCTIVELLTGKPPYYELEPVSALFKIVSEDFYPYPETVSAECYGILTSCFQRDPNLRISAARLLQHPWITGEKASRQDNQVTAQNIARVKLSKYRDEDQNFYDYSDDFDLEFDDLNLALKTPSDAENVALDAVESYSLGIRSWNEVIIEMMQKESVSSPSLLHQIFYDSLNRYDFVRAYKFYRLQPSSDMLSALFKSLNQASDSVIDPLAHIDIQILLLIQKCNSKEPFTFEDEVDVFCNLVLNCPCLAFELFQFMMEDVLSRNLISLRIRFLSQFRNGLQTLSGSDKNNIRKMIASTNIPLILLQILCDDKSNTILHRESVEVLLEISHGSRDIRYEMCQEIHIRHIIEALEMGIHPITMELKLYKLVKNLFRSTDANIIETCASLPLIKLLSNSLWKNHASTDMEIPSVVLSALSSILHLKQDRLDYAISNGLLEFLLGFSNYKNPVKQFILQLFCDIASYATVPEECAPGILDVLLCQLGDVCWRSSAFDAIARWLRRNSKVTDLLISKKMKPLFEDNKCSFKNMQDNFLAHLIRICKSDSRIISHLLSEHILSVLDVVTSNDPKVMLDLLQVIKLMYLTDRYYFRSPSELRKLIHIVQRVQKNPTDLIMATATSIMRLIAPHPTESE